MRAATAIALLALVAGAPARAQHAHHESKPVAEAAPAVTPSDPEPRDTPPAESIDPHAGHHMPPVAGTGADAPPADLDPHAGHQVAPAASDPHAAHRAQATNAATGTPIPPLTDADRAAAFPPLSGHAAHDRRVHFLWRFDEFELVRDGGAGWESEAWIGGDVDRLWVRTEGEMDDGALEHASIELLAGRGVSAWWDVVAGVRHDWGAAPSQSFLAVGVQGLAPYKIEFEATAYLGQGGQAGLGVEAGYETLLSSRWIAQWDVEMQAWSRGDARRGVGAGLATVSAGVRVRYEITRRFAPYVGVEVEQAFGGTADLRRAHGDEARDTRVVAGVRFWF